MIWDAVCTNPMAGYLTHIEAGTAEKASDLAWKELIAAGGSPDRWRIEVSLCPENDSCPLVEE